LKVLKPVSETHVVEEGLGLFVIKFFNPLFWCVFGQNQLAINFHPNSFQNKYLYSTED